MSYKFKPEQLSEYLEMRDIDPELSVDEFVKGRLAFEQDRLDEPSNTDRLSKAAKLAGALLSTEQDSVAPTEAPEEVLGNVVFLFQQNSDN